MAASCPALSLGHDVEAGTCAPACNPPVAPSSLAMDNLTSVCRCSSYSHCDSVVMLFTNCNVMPVSPSISRSSPYDRPPDRCHLMLDAPRINPESWAYGPQSWTFALRAFYLSIGLRQLVQYAGMDPSSSLAPRMPAHSPDHLTSITRPPMPIRRRRPVVGRFSSKNPTAPRGPTFVVNFTVLQASH